MANTDGFTQLFNWMTGVISISAEKYIPSNKDGISFSEAAIIAKTNPVVKKCIKLRKSNFGANGWNIKCKMFRSPSRNEDIESQVYNLLLNSGINSLKSQYAVQLGIYGNIFASFDNDNKPILHRPDLYHQYWSTLQSKATKYALVIDGAEQKGLLGNLQEGVDVVHLKNPDSNHQPWADSPIDASYDWILFYQHAVQANNLLASRGWVNILALLPENDRETSDYLQKKDEQGKTGAQNLGERLQNWFGGTKNSSKIAILNRIREIKEVGRTNREMQFVESQDVIAQQIAHPFGFTLADLGKDVTYSNAATFNYAQWDMVGRDEEDQFAELVNNFWLPRMLALTESRSLLEALKSGELFFKFYPPGNPNKMANIKLDLEIADKMIGYSDNPEYKAKIINEFRDKIDLDPIDPAFLTIPEPITPRPSEVVDVKTKETFTKKTPIEKALASREFSRTDSNGTKKGFLPHLEGKIAEQITAYTAEILKKKSVNEVLYNNIDVDFPPITNFYKRKDIKKDLIVFAKIGYKNFLEETKKEKFAKDDLPESIMKAVVDRVDFLLGDDRDYAGIDLFTMEILKKLISDNLDLSVPDLVKIIIGEIPMIASKRAKVIAETEIAYEVENSRFLGYLDAGYRWKRWLTVNDPRVRIAHKENERIGIIPMGDSFPNGNMKAGEDPFCRCSTVYGVDKSDIE